MKASSEQGETELSKKLLAVSFVTTLAVIACTAEGPTTPPQTETIQRAEEPVVSATPVPTPVTAPAPGTSSFELTGAKPSTIYVKYTGEASFATIVTFYTSFDDQKTPFGKQSHTVKSGDTVTRVFDQRCIQGDADQEGVKEIGGVFFDIDGAPFNPTRNPEKVTECRNQCVPRWDPLEEVRSIGEWTEYTPENQPSTQDPKCYKYERKLVIKRERNTCTKEERDRGEQYYEYRQTEIQCPCVLNPSYSQNVTRTNYSNGTPAVPESAYWYWDMDNGEGNTPKQNACEGRGGVWLGDDYNIPNDGSNNEYDDVCRVTTGPSFPGGPGADVDFIKKVVVTPAVPATSKNGIVLVGSVTGDDATWRFKLTCGETTKDDESFTRTCEQGSKTLPAETTGGIQIGDGQFGYISSTDHEGSTCYLEVFKNGSLLQTITYLPVN